MLVALIQTAGSISGAHFNPAVSFADASQGGFPPGEPMDKVIFACVHNAGRSQMAAAFFNRIADRARAEAVSAGTQPGSRVHPVVVDVMNEIGIDLSLQKPQRLTESLATDAKLLVTMGCGDECPYVPGLKTQDWALADPKDQPLAIVRQIRDDIKNRVSALVSSRDWSARSAGSG